MSFFESLIALLAVAIVLLQVSRRLGLPYPAMLAAAGVLLAIAPGAPQIDLDPRMLLALFLAPVLTDAAFDFPVTDVRRLWRPLFALAVVAVTLSAAAVAALGVGLAGLPVAAAVALGAIVAPPDAAAATAVLSNVSMPRRSIAVLKGEGLLNDASALLLFGAATSIQVKGGINTELALQLAIAGPGGVLAGVILGKLFRRVTPIVSGTLGGNLLEFVTSFGVWIMAERMGLSPVLCLVGFAMTVARYDNLSTPPRVRIHSFAVWETAVFLLNVLAFLLMGLRAHTIVAGMTPARLRHAAGFALCVVVCLIVVRMAWVLLYNLLAQRFRGLRGDFQPAGLRHGVVVGWCGMRGLVTLAAAFALPGSFPQRDLIVLTAFAVVLSTLVVQGLTLSPLVRLLKLDGDQGLPAELAEIRRDLALAGLEALRGQHGPAAAHWRYVFNATKAASADAPSSAALDEKRRLGLRAMRRQRRRLETLRREGRVGADAYQLLQEELDFNEIALSPESDRQIEEI